MQSRNALRDLALATFILALSVSGCGRKPAAGGDRRHDLHQRRHLHRRREAHLGPKAAAVRDGRIVAVGRNEDVLPFKGDTTRVVDLAGRMALPGFHDSHVHVAAAGLEELQCPLYDLQYRRGDPRRGSGLRAPQRG